MSLNDILGSAMSGLAASQASLRSVSNNIANVGTTGYARERVMLSTAVTAGRISGVQGPVADSVSLLARQERAPTVAPACPPEKSPSSP